ncbi:MAG TPA: 16S rRNA (cytidine(1402)-2'-O)-methyltransferase, partial [Bacteroidales bacterium]|nr:16S rRNA (cytidine(1402)-2'-O)-methyltransferase [Bacteroidales bacterium]
ITIRALEVLGSAGLILAEDTRTTRVLLNHYNIKVPLQSHHKFNEHKSVEAVCDRIEQGTVVALVSDAGTPGISDPGFLLVRQCLERDLEVESLPGATAFIPALVNSGLPCDRFCFEGFLPLKKGRQKRLLSLAAEERTIVLYESPFRVLKTLRQLADIFGEERRISVSRELTKKFEETVRGPLSSVIEHFTTKPPKGEFVIIIAGTSFRGHAGEDPEEED